MKSKQWGNPEQMMVGKQYWTLAQTNRANQLAEQIMTWWKVANEK